MAIGLVLLGSLTFSDGGPAWLQLGLLSPVPAMWLVWLGLRWWTPRRVPSLRRDWAWGLGLLSVALLPTLGLLGLGGYAGEAAYQTFVAALGAGGATALTVLLLVTAGALCLGKERRPAWSALGRAVRAARLATRPAIGFLKRNAHATRVGRAMARPEPLPDESAPTRREHPAWSKRDRLIIRRPTAPAPRTSKEAPAEPSAASTASAGWRLPSLDLLSTSARTEVAEADLRQQARVIEETLAQFRLDAKVVEVQQGPAVTQFGLDPAPGMAVDRIAARAHDLALRLGARSIRIQAPIPGRPLLGIEVPNGETSLVALRDVLEGRVFRSAVAGSTLPVALGQDVSGAPVVVDLAKMPHLLIAGATGSGKSVALNAILCSLLVCRTPHDVRFILIDPKRVELAGYTGVPHLRLPVVTDMERVLGALRWALAELEARFARFASATCRNLEAFNKARASERMPHLVLVIDELADLMMRAPGEVERGLCRLAQLGRAAGIHLVVATQRPSVDVLTGLIKANLPARLAFAVSSLVDSRVVLDIGGAEQLLGRGDMLFQAPDAAKARRIQGAYVDEREVRAIVSHWRRQGGTGYAPEEESQLSNLGQEALEVPDEALLRRARELAETQDQLSASFLQRRLGVGYPKAARLMELLRDVEEADR